VILYTKRLDKQLVEQPLVRPGLDRRHGITPKIWARRHQCIWPPCKIGSRIWINTEVSDIVKKRWLFKSGILSFDRPNCTIVSNGIEEVTRIIIIVVTMKPSKIVLKMDAATHYLG